MEKEEINEANKKELQILIKDLVKKMGIECEVESKKIDNDDQSSLIFNIKTKESNYLIGQYGINLQALQHISRIIFRSKTESKANFIIDVNSYRQEKNESITDLAKKTAEQVLKEKKAITLRPMSAYERRLVHMELSKNEQIKTESLGEGEDRRVAIKPVELV